VAGLTTPAPCAPLKASDPATASNPSVAFSLMQESPMVRSPPQRWYSTSLDSKFNKKTDDEVSIG